MWFLGGLVGSIEMQAVKSYDGMLCSVMAGKVWIKVFYHDFYYGP